MTVFKPGDRVHLKGHAHTPATTGTVRDATPGWPILVRWDDGPAITPHDPQHLEPAGEPMSTTFTSNNVADAPIHHLTVDDIDGEVLVQVHYGSHLKGVCVAKREAPALALAILEAAGEPMAPEVARAMEALEEYKQRIQIEAEGAADREKLDSEALDLYNRVMRSGKEPLSEWLSTLQFTRIKYTNIAKAARERYGVTK